MSNFRCALTSPLMAASIFACWSIGCAEGADADPKPHKDAGAIDAGAHDESCVKNPKTASDILNACTESDVESVDKKPDLPLLLKDGGLPPLP